MNWSAPLDFYCERTDAAFWSEPFNAATNAAFLVAAALAFRRWRAAGGGDPAVLALICVVVAVGIGSFLFHTVATRWALYADVVPIQLFIVGYFLLAVRRFAGLGRWTGLAATAAFLLLARELPGLTPSWLRGGSGYLGGLVALFGLGSLLAAEIGRGPPAGLSADAQRAAGLSLIVTGVVFLASLTARSFDLQACRYLFTGTHPVWHILNAVVLYRLLALATGTRAVKRAFTARREL